jgi:Plasmid stabilization system protein
MEEKEIRLIWRRKALSALISLHRYISENNPQNADVYIARMIHFIQGLTIMPEKFAPCRFEKFAIKGYSCVVFEKNYIVFYKVVQETLYVCNIIRTSRLK